MMQYCIRHLVTRSCKVLKGEICGYSFPIVLKFGWNGGTCQILWCKHIDTQFHTFETWWDLKIYILYDTELVPWSVITYCTLDTWDKLSDILINVAIKKIDLKMIYLTMFSVSNHISGFSRLMKYLRYFINPLKPEIWLLTHILWPTELIPRNPCPSV